MADHCRSFALSDPKEHSFDALCDHQHNDVCIQCALLPSTITDIKAGLSAQSDNLPSTLKEELTFRCKQAKTATLAWKSHLLRSVNRDGARAKLFEEMDETSIIVV